MNYKDKISKLLALAQSPEEAEAKEALLKARKLMAEHKLTEADLEDDAQCTVKMCGQISHAASAAIHG